MRNKIERQALAEMIADMIWRFHHLSPEKTIGTCLIEYHDQADFAHKIRRVIDEYIRDRA